ncbi:MAG: DUF5906 domain-containing protein [Clostridia bacterium]|nr:DUF5906 domain-containing protein [Clostridia bacterium]
MSTYQKIIKPIISYNNISNQSTEYVNHYNSNNVNRVLNLYNTNGSLPEKVRDLFAACVCEYKPIPNRDEKIDTTEIINAISNLLTQKLRIIVRHDDNLYFYNGHIFIVYPDTKALLPAIREFCEIASSMWGNFRVHSGIVKAILSNISQTACETDSQSDIHKYVVFRDGILNLETGFFYQNTPDFFITNMIDAYWNTNEIYCPFFDKLIDDYTCSDYVLRDRLLEALGLCLTNDIVKKIICFVGVTNSGKSTLVNFLLELHNASSVVTMQPNEFDRQFALSRIYEKSIIACMDMEAKPLSERATAILKNISGHDRVGAEFKYRNGCKLFVSRAHVILCSNYAIRSYKEDIAFKERLLIIPFTKRIEENGLSLDYIMDQLKREKNAIVKKLIYAYVRLKQNNYIFSGTNGNYDEYIPNNISYSNDVEDDFTSFLREHIIFTGCREEYVFTDELFEYYQNYAKAYGKTLFLNFDAFSKCASKLIKSEKSKKRRSKYSNPQACYFGVKLR